MIKFRILEKDGEFRLQRKWLKLFWRNCYFSTGKFYHPEQLVHEGHDTVHQYSLAKRRVTALVNKIKEKKRGSRDWLIAYVGDGND